VEVANGVYHVVARGNERQRVFRDDHDRERFLEILGAVAQRYEWRVHCYCLMENHYHLLVLTLTPNLARGMRQLNGVYAQWFNRRHDRVGHLFQGRYKAVLVQREKHFADTVRYIVRNPVRAGLTTKADEWRWTSHAATIGNRRPGVVAVADLLSCLGPEPSSARARYADLVGGEADPAVSLHPLFAGDEDFVETSLSLVRPSPEHPRAYVEPCRRRPPLAELVRGGDDAAAVFAAFAEHGYSLRQIATHLGCGVTTVHRRVRAHELAQAMRRD
jgi:REP element-mobilizing transposase RayT